MFALDELYLVAVRIFHERDHCGSMLHRPGRARNPAATLFDFVTGFVGVIDFQRYMSVAGAKIILGRVPVVSQLEHRLLVFGAISNECERKTAVGIIVLPQHLQDGARGLIPETPKPGDPLFARTENRVIATAHRSLEAAGEVFRAHGIVPAILGDSITGEAREVGNVMAAIAREVRIHGLPLASPVALISGGECTVTVRGNAGRGGRCSEFLLSLAIELGGLKAVHAIAADTDGIDGSEDNAGAVLAPDSLERAARQGLDAEKLLAANDAWGFFSGIGDLVHTGPTLTNVNDYRAILIL